MDHLKLFENFEHLTFDVTTEDDTTTIECMDGSKKVGESVFERVFDGYWYFDDQMSEDEFYSIFPDGEYINLRHLKIDDEHIHHKYGTALMDKTMEEMKRTKIKKAYLNASPMGDKGPKLSGLVKFYQRFGFRPMGKNSLWHEEMVADL